MVCDIQQIILRGKKRFCWVDVLNEKSGLSQEGMRVIFIRKLNIYHKVNILEMLTLAYLFYFFFLVSVICRCGI